MAETEKPFACDVSGCGIKFVCEDKLTSHKRRHKMMLSLNFTNTGAGPKNCIEQTPTPTRFIDVFEEAGLFQELQPEFATPEAVHVNPFEADFRRASHGEIISKEPSNVSSTSEPLNTPCILPVTADPIALRAQLTPPSAMVAEFGPVLPLATKAQPTSGGSALVLVDKSAIQVCSTSVSDSNQLKPATVVSTAPGGKGPLVCAAFSDKMSSLQGSVSSIPQTTAIGVVTTETSLAATSPITQVLPGVSAANVASLVAAPVMTPSVAPVVPAVSPLPGPKSTTIITPSNVIQIGDSVQLLIVANSAATVGSTAQLLPAAATTSATVPLLQQQNTETKLKDALAVKGLISGGEKQAPKCTAPAPQIPGTVIAPSNANLSDGNQNRRADAIDDERKKKNRENNRYAAQRSRAKKKRMSEAVRKELEDYKKLCAELTARNQELLNQRSMSREMELQYKDEIFNLKKQLALHSNCPVTLELRKNDKDGHKKPRKLSTETVPQVKYLLSIAEQDGHKSPRKPATELHLAALSSLKNEVYDLAGRLQQVSQEKEALERKLSKRQLERLQAARDREDRLEQQAQRYEERIIELHSVIAELSKKLDLQRAAVIKEEDEFSQQSGDESRVSDVMSHCTSNENLATESISDKDNESPPEFTDVISGKCATTEVVVPMQAHEGEDTSSGLGDNESFDDKPQGFHSSSSGSHGVRGGGRVTTVEHRATSCQSLQASQLQEEVTALRSQNIGLQERLARQEADLQRSRAATAALREERDRCQRKVRDLQQRVATSPQGSCNPALGGSSSPLAEQVAPPVAKMAERIRLRKTEPPASSQRLILGSEMANLGISSSKVAEQLVQQLQEEAHTQEAIAAQRLCSSGSPLPEGRLREFEVEIERVNSKVEHLRCQNDLLQLTLEESRGQCDRLSVLLGKHESNQTALQLALACSDRALEAFDALLALADTSRPPAGCRAGSSSEEEEEMLHRAQEERRLAEGLARQVLHRLDRQCGGGLAVSSPSCVAASPWEDLSSHSHTTSTTSSTSSSCDGELTKVEEQRLREHLVQLREERAALRATLLELESVHVEPRGATTLLDAHKLDLENAVLMQELMAIKEEKAELKAQNYLMEKEKAALELRAGSWEAREQAYMVSIEHLRAQLADARPQQQPPPRQDDTSPEIQELAESQKREKCLKARIDELVGTLEKITKNAELRSQQSAEFVNDLKRANSALVSAFEKMKKKNMTKLRRAELQMAAMSERHNSQVQMLKQRIAMLEGSGLRHVLPLSGSETSL